MADRISNETIEYVGMLQDYSFRNDQVVVSVLINTERPEQALNFVDFLMQGE